MWTMFVMSALLGGFFVGGLAVAFTLRHVNKDFKEWFDNGIWSGEE